jgi:tRNA(adenine34) deaminase
MLTEYAEEMLLALQEAELSLREGNSGFGAIITRDGAIIAQAHDTEKSENDPTAHAELTAIRQAAARIGRDLHGCRIVSTHEPCPMCATAILGSGIDTIIYGFSISEAISQSRRRINLPCQELFKSAGIKPIQISEEKFLRQRFQS